MPLSLLLAQLADLSAAQRAAAAAARRLRHPAPTLAECLRQHGAAGEDAVVRACQLYAAEDNRVAVFLKILQHEIDEEFPQVQQQLRATVQELLKLALQRKYPRKAKDEILALLHRKTTSHLWDDEWEPIVRYMYAPEDAALICRKVREVADSAGDQAPPHPGGRSSIAYSQLLQVLLDFQLRGHEAFLAPFVARFREWDRDGDGVLTESEFCGLLRDIAPSKTGVEIAETMDRIDPHHTGCFPFSACVASLPDELAALNR